MAAPLPDGFVLEGQSAPPLPEGFQIEGADPTGPAAFNPTNGQSTAEKLITGVGQGVTKTGLGAEQLLGHVPGLAWMLGMPSYANPEVAAKVDEAARLQKQLDKPLLDTTAGKAGSFGGQALASSVVGPGVGGAGILGAGLRGATQGAMAAALDPVETQGGIESLIKGDQPQSFAAQKLGQMGMGAGVGGVVGGGLQGVGSLLSNLVPKNAVATAFNKLGAKEADTPFAKEGEQLAQDTGVPLTPAQISGSKGQAKIENFARQSLFGADKVFANDQAAVGKWVDHINNTIDGIGNSTSTADAGERIQGVVKNAVVDLSQKRATQAAQDFGAVRAMTQGKAAIEPTNTAQALQDIIDEHAGVGAPSSDALAAFAKKQLANVAPSGTDVMSSNPVVSMLRKAAPEQQQAILNSLSQSDPAMFKQVQSALNPVAAPAEGNLDKIMKLRSYLSSVAGGQSKISGDPVDRKVASQLLGTIDQDIDQNATAIGGDLGAALKTANSNYRQASQAIDGVHEMALGKLLGTDAVDHITGQTFSSVPGETVMQKMLAMKPSQISMARGLLEQYSPETLQDVKATILDQALQKAQQSAPSAGARTLPANTGAYIKALPDSDKITALFKPEEVNDINRTIAVSQRLADRTGSNFSGTAPMMEIASFLKAAPRALVGDPTAMAQVSAQIAAPKAIAKVMANPEGRALVQKLSLAPPGSDVARDLAAKLSAISGAEQMNGEAR